MVKPIFQILILLLAVVSHRATAFTPIGQWAQTAVLINSTVYIYGGARLNEAFGSRNLYTLDVSLPWTYTSPTWTDHSSDIGNSFAPLTAFHTVWPSNDNKSFYVWGGGNTFSGNMTESGFAQYYVNTSAWSIPSGTAAINVPQQRRESVAALTSLGVAYIWGGFGDSATGYTVNGTSASKIFNEMISFDTNKLVWTVLNFSGQVSPTPRIEYTSTILPNNQIVMIGGLTGVQINSTYVYLHYASMTDIPVFDTNAGTWTANNATGNTPVARRMHTAVLASDGFSIIICCGGTQSDDVNLNDVAVLDTRTWLWMQPATNGSVPTGRFAPSSVMVNGQMLIFFGYDNNGKGLNDVAILDTRSTQHYQWASSFFPNSSPPSSSTENIGGSSGTGGIDAIGGIGGIVGIVIGVLILVAILVFLLVRKPWRARSDSEFRQEQDAPHRGAPPTGPQQQFNPINQKPDQYNQEPDQDNRKPNQYNQESDQNNQKPDVDDRLNEIEI